MIKEKEVGTFSGYIMIAIFLGLLGGFIGSFVMRMPIPVFVLGFMMLVILPGFFIVNPNSSKVLVLFGKYVGSVKKDGFHWANPFYIKKKVSLRARNLDSEKIKVNDKLGNPIIISAVIVWKVEETAKALFEVNDYVNFIRIQSDAAVRNMAGKYPYDNFDDDYDDNQHENSEITLRSGGEMVNDELENELRERLDKAGVQIIEARITHLAYSEEIAGAMLQRQQATAIIAARRKIVEGAVGMVEMALQRLEKDNVIKLDEDKQAAMVSNLMVVLCSDKAASPIVNAGTLHN